MVVHNDQLSYTSTEKTAATDAFRSLMACSYSTLLITPSVLAASSFPYLFRLILCLTRRRSQWTYI